MLCSANKFLELDPIFYQLIDPTPLKDPILVSINTKLVKELSLCDDIDFIKIINGEISFNSMQTYAMCYAGHQFGYYMPMLGDGRAINIGRHKDMYLQLKGSGKTRYSRDGDGRAVLRSSIREYLVSEAMYALGIPTTRAVGIIGSNEKVLRDKLEPASIVLRASPSWIRFGTFEYFYYKRKYKELQELADFVISESYPHLIQEKNKYLMMFQQIVHDTAILIAKWQSVGFNHGVMNTDNMSITSLTLDYGPFAFLDDYDLNYVCNHTDEQGRYSFANQPDITQWNLSMLMQTLTPLANSDAMAKVLFGFRKIFKRHYTQIMRNKLGLFTDKAEDGELIVSLLDIMQQQSVDYTYFFRTLSNYLDNTDVLLEHIVFKKPMQEWLQRYDLRVKKESLATDERLEKMKKINPKFILKNYILQEAIEKAYEKDFSLVNDLLAIVQAPYDEHYDYERYAEPTPSKYKNSKLSCSS